MAERSPADQHVVVIGDLLLDIVIPPRSAPLSAPDVVGEVQFRQGGSASTTARWLARLGMPTSLIASVGRDVLGDALVSYMERCKVRVHAVRPPRLRTGRMVVLLDHKGERSFVADRRAALALSAPEIRRAWFRGARALHAPAYCLFGEPLASATRYAVELAKENGAFLSVDLASASFIVAHGSHHVHDEVAALKPEVLVGTAAEARALLGHSRVAELTSIAPIVVVKKGALGATVLLRSDPVQSFDVPTHRSPWWTRPERETPSLRAFSRCGCGAARGPRHPLACWRRRYALVIELQRASSWSRDPSSLSVLRASSAPICSPTPRCGVSARR